MRASFVFSPCASPGKKKVNKVKFLLGYTVAIACASPRNSIWFTRSFLLVKGWGLGRRLGERHIVQRKKTMFFCFLLLLRKLRSSQDSNWVLLNVNIHFTGAAARLLCDECFNTDYATTKLLHMGKEGSGDAR